MLLDLFLKFWATPENIIGLILNILMMVDMCLIFRTWQEKWWKSLIPFYGTYVLYKNTWKGMKWVFVIQLFFQLISTRCLSFARKHIATNLFQTIQTYIETEQFAVDISITKLVTCLFLFLISTLVVFVLTRVTYMKICSSLHIDNVLLKIGTFLFPEVFLLVDYITYRKLQSKF